MVLYKVGQLTILVISILVHDHRVSAVTCSSGWTKYGENCYRLYTSKLPWMDALKACQTVGSSLVDVGSDGEQNFVHNLANGNEFWISGSDSSTEGHWLWYGSIQSWSYTKWNTGEPNDSGGEDCASLLSGGKWNDYPCSRDMAYICEQTTALDACDSSWSFRNGKCYKLFTSKARWSNALKTCQANSANLVNIEDASENSYVHGLLSGNDIWMGGFDGPKEGSWAWSGGVFSWSYTNWNTGEPNNSGDEDCALMFENSGKWNDGSCGAELQFLCKKNTPPIDGGWASYGSYGSCSVTCGGGTQTRSRTCTNPAPQWGGDQCPGSSTDSQSCNTNPCPIDGNWGSWGNWDTCTVTCGGGTQQRTRTCSNPAPQYNGADCTGDSTSSQTCNTNPCPIDGLWASWGSWETCTVTCGGGTQDRFRTCTNPQPQYGGADCVGANNSTQDCNTQVCIIDGAWGAWGQWGTCSVTCGGGQRSRTRICDNPTPANGGKDCPGSSGDYGDCNTDACPTVAPGQYSQLCPSGYFTCQSGGMSCIQESFKCDCSSDCEDGSDETEGYAGCTNVATCSAQNGAGTAQIAASIVVFLSSLIAICTLLM